MRRRGTRANGDYERGFKVAETACVLQVQIRRVVIITEVDEGHCRHTITGEVKVRIVGIGKLVEKYVMENTISALGLLDSVVAR